MRKGWDNGLLYNKAKIFQEVNSREGYDRILWTGL